MSGDHLPGDPPGDAGFGRSFLRQPDLFPARRAGEPWGERALDLDVAGGPYRFTGLAAGQEEALRRRFPGLCRPAGAVGAPAAVAVFRAPASDFLPIDTRGWEYALDLEPGPIAVQVAGLRLMARLDWTPSGLAGALWTPEAAGEEWTSVGENFLRLVAAYRLLEEGGALLHSGGVADGARAWLLLGPAGAGKSTASRLCLEAGAEVLSDDLNAVIFQSGSPSVARLPFTGDLGATGGPRAGGGGYPLAGLLRLRKAPEDRPGERVEPLSPAAALAALLAASPYANRDPYRRDALLAVLERLARAVPAWELTFSLGADLWAILKKLPT